MSLYPAEIVSYDKARRRVRIKAVGLTDGDSMLPESELLYSMGDNSKKTEIEINAGDLVWIDFIADDRRYPVVMGFRNPESGNSVDWRKWHHKNIELSADDTLKIRCKNLVFEAETTTHSGVVSMTGAVAMASSLAVAGAMSNGGVTVGKDHKHNENGDGGGVTSPPI